VKKRTVAKKGAAARKGSSSRAAKRLSSLVPAKPALKSETTLNGPRYWLLKQEPTDFSFDDLWARPDRTTNWEGVRNYRARNFLRDEIKRGDLAFFYHSNANPSAVVGIVEVVRDGYPDETAFDPKSDYYDADSDRAKPRWFQVDVRAVEKFPTPVALGDIKKVPALKNMMLLRISQLSVQAVTAAEWDVITRAARGRGA
jgi:predicted RNA-binding protein with PUA-like domain